MGEAVIVKCSNCMISKQYIMGIGMLYYSLSNVASNLHWKKRRKLERFQNTGTIISEDFEHRIFHCQKCNNAYSKFWVKVERDDGEIFETTYHCPKCKLELIDNHNDFSQYKCSHCGQKTLNAEIYIMWD